MAGDRYFNYRLPGQTQDENNINQTYATGMSQGIQGATSGGDVLDLATRFAYGKNRAFGALGAQEAQGKDAAFGDYTAANAAAGQEAVNKNAYDRDQYGRGLDRAAALEQAGATNTYGALDQVASAGSKYLLSKADPAKAADTQNKKIQSIYSKYFLKNDFNNALSLSDSLGHGL